MVVTNDVKLPEYEDLDTIEVNVSSATLMAAAPYLGKYCEGINNEYMLCRVENNNPIPCVELGKNVTKCTMEFFQKLKGSCLHEHKQYAHCIDQSSGNYQPWHCRKTHKVYEKCIRTKMSIDHPGFGYFTRGRIHKSGFMPKPEEPCPCLPNPDPNHPDAKTPFLPDSKKRCSARFSSRLYWMTE